MLEILRSGSLLLDAAMGTTLLSQGLQGRAPAWNLSHADQVQAVHEAHVRAGAELVLTNTFVGATAEEARAALRLARASGARYVGGCLWAGLSGLGEQVAQLVQADSIWLEAATSARQALEALRAARAATSLPIVVTCALTAAPLDELRAAGAAAAGYACSPWPSDARGADVIKLAAEGLSALDWARKLPPARLRGGCCGTDERYLIALRATAR
ncbi:MAG TPA: homocysteine S-methyltransferase family protein [Myxococcales bacterium]|nr:homocysteine S-methyltransferase family protein [Myxococcales bacterium]